MFVLVEISTKNRDAVLGRCLAGLLQQSFQNFDVLILNDGEQKVGMTQSTDDMIGLLKENHDVIVRQGSKISQAHNHNIALYEHRDYLYILRLDDDIILNRDAIEHMFWLLNNLDASAVGGLWFEMEYQSEQLHDRNVIDWNLKEELETLGAVGDINSNWQQRMYHPTDHIYPVQHLYSVCMYNAVDMRSVGGWPEVYSKGVAHGEETDGTYKLHLAGHKLYVDPRVTGQHLKSSGGIRSNPMVGRAQAIDNAKWVSRIHQLEEITNPPTVAVWCQHAYGYGGAQRQFYKTVNGLQSRSGMIVDPVFTSKRFSPEECEEAFGFSYEERDQKEEYDICIVMGHEPFKPVKAKKYMLYQFFPDQTELDFDGFELLLANSKYSAGWGEFCTGYKTRHLYPPVDPLGIRHSDFDFTFSESAKTVHHLPGYVKKTNSILVVCRADPHKAPLWLVEKFVELNLEGWHLNLVMAHTDVFSEYEDQVIQFVSEHENINLYQDISDSELSNLYRFAKILWHAKGIYAENNPSEAEHFGLVPIEAWSAGCVPIVYDLGGHRETVDERYRWTTKEELFDITRKVINDGYLEVVNNYYFHYYLEGQPADPVDTSKYVFSSYIDSLEDWIFRVHWMSVEQEKVEQIQVKEKKIRVAAIADSYRLTTGFGIVANEIYKRICQQDDMELYTFGIMDTDILHKDEMPPFEYYPAPPNDLQGHKTIPKFMNWAKPDVVWNLYDPGNSIANMMCMRALGQNLRWINYFPVEGLRPNKQAYRLVELSDFPVTYCHAGADALMAFSNKRVHVAYHGADHADFKPPEDREKIRRLVGWDDKFVIYNVGTNKRVKQQPYLIEALKILLERGYDDVYLYLHTKKYDDNVMQGWDLGWIIDSMSESSGIDLSSRVFFPAEFEKKWHGTPWEYMDSFDYDKMTVPPTSQGRGALFYGLDFITRYGIADLYVDVSSAEGWGLPPLEAVACGTPTISVDDGMARSEVHSKYCKMIKPKHWTTWHTGSILQLVDPVDVADAIIEARENGIDKTNSVMQDLRWDDTAQLFIDAIRQVYKDSCGVV